MRNAIKTFSVLWVGAFAISFSIAAAYGLAGIDLNASYYAICAVGGLGWGAIVAEFVM